MGYLTSAGIEAAVDHVATTYPAIAQRIALPETSVEGRSIHALKLAHGGGTRRGVLLIGGVHARELINPDLLASLALRLCESYTNGADLVLGGKTYSVGVVKLLIDAMDLLVLPLVNPDGREFVQAPGGDAMWRKNRSLNGGAGCLGVDINRNYDLLFDSGIGTSSSACSDVFRGPSAFSEPETRNVRWMLDTYQNVMGMVDVHSYMQLFLYPWGDDADQTTDPSQNFQNPAYNGVRGNDALYKEYIAPVDQTWFVNTGTRVRDAIAAVRGRTYTVEQSVQLYPTSGTSHDYAFSRQFVTAAERKVWAYTLETATEFQPPYAEALQVMDEASAGLVQFCIQCLCAVETSADGLMSDDELDGLRRTRDDVVADSEVGSRLVALFELHSGEIVERLAADPALRARVREVLPHARTVVEKDGPLPSELRGRLESLLDDLACAGEKPSLALLASLEEVRGHLGALDGHPVRTGLRSRAPVR
jgi:carboxypeptidase T